MALYRFLFAPVLLAIAVLIGARERAAKAPPTPAPVADVQHASATDAGALAPAGTRAASRSLVVH